MNEAGRRKLVDEHLQLARAVAICVKKELGAPAVELEDLVAYGTEGLLEAAHRYDSRFGASFKTFAYYRIRGAIYDGLRRMGQFKRGDYARLRIAERSHELCENLAERERGAKAGAAPAPDLEDDVRSLSEALSGLVASYVTSLDALVDEGSDFVDEGLDVEELAVLKQACARVRQAMEKLPPKERYFIEKHYFQGMTLQDAGAELGLTKSWASRLHSRAVHLLRQELTSNP